MRASVPNAMAEMEPEDEHDWFLVLVVGINIRKDIKFYHPKCRLPLTGAGALHEVAVVLLAGQIDGAEGDGRDAAAHLRAHPHVVLRPDLEVVVRVIHLA